MKGLKRGVGARALARATVETLEGRRLLSQATIGFPSSTANTAGMLDGTFSEDGRATFSAGAESGFTDVAVQPDGRILAVGQVGTTQFDGFTVPLYGVTRWNLDGSRDLAFGGGDGYAELPASWTADNGPDNWEISLVGDGTFVVGGEAYWGGLPGVARFTSEGMPDTTLRSSGFFEQKLNDLSPGLEDAKVLSQPDGKIIVVAHGPSALNSGIYGIHVYRYNKNGTPDSTFNSNGHLFFNTGGFPDALDAVLLPSGKIAITAVQSGTSLSFLARVTSGGQLDSAFGQGGILSPVATQPATLTALSDDGVLLTYSNWITKYLPGGTPDNAFGFQGTAFMVSGFNFTDVKVQLDGKIVAAGTSTTAPDFMIERLLVSGQPDQSFGTSGYQVVNLGDVEAPRAVELEPDGRVVIGGLANGGSLGLLVRLTNDSGIVMDETGLLRISTEFGETVTVSGVESAAGTPAAFEVSFTSNGMPVRATQRFSSSIQKVAIFDSAAFGFPSLLVKGNFANLPKNIQPAVASSVAVEGTGGADTVLIYQDELVTGGVHIAKTTTTPIVLNTFGGNDYVHVFNGLNSPLILETGDGNDLVLVDAADLNAFLKIQLGAGDDELYVPWKAKADTLDGGTGDDTLRVSGSDGADQYVVTAGQIQMDGFGTAVAKYSGMENLHLSMGLGNDLASIDAGVTAKVLVVAGGGKDFVECYCSSSCTLFGEAGNDTLTAGRGADSINGGDGDDVITTIDLVKDTIDGGAGTDEAYADSVDQLQSIESAYNNSISGRVFQDTNGNGVIDLGEPTITGRTVYIDKNNNGTRDISETTATSSVNGVYSFYGLLAGLYTVRQVVPTSWATTSPASGSYLVNLPGAFDAANRDFGSKQTAGQMPYKGVPFQVVTGATVIQAEDYDLGGEGVAYHDNDAANLGGKYRTGEGVDLETVSGAATGSNIGYVYPGEWTEYSINIGSSGVSSFTFNVASTGSGGQFHLELDGVNVTGAIIMPNTGGWQSWQTVTKSGISVGAGDHVLRLVGDVVGSSGAVGNFDAITILWTPPLPPSGTQAPYATRILTATAPVTIEAEDFDHGGEGVAYHDVEAANLGGSYRGGDGVDLQVTGDSSGAINVGWTVGGEWLEYTINADAGNYNAEFRVASPGTGGKFHLEVDGVDATGAMTVPNTGGWQSWTTVGKVINLSAGTHVLRLAMDQVSSAGGVGNFNWIRLSSVAVPPPPPPSGQTPYKGTPFVISASAAATIEAEDFDAGGEGVAYHDTAAFNQGGQYRTGEGIDIETVGGDSGAYNVGYVAAGEWLEYSVDVTDSGTYNFDFRVASNGNGGAFHVEVDGADVTGAMTVPNTSGWQSWTTVTKSGVALAKGQHIVRLAMDTVGATGAVGNFNYMKVYSGNVPPPPSGQTPFKGTPFAVGSGTTTIQVEDFDHGGEGVAYHDVDNVNQPGNVYRSGGVDIENTGDSGGGFDVGYVKAGEWLEYTIDVATAKAYTLDFRVAAVGAGGLFHLEVDGV
ncbi:MAG TPA: carbohydrate-binding protein, partial [Tepidisphaeraceae bacterium]